MIKYTFPSWSFTFSLTGEGATWVRPGKFSVLNGCHTQQGVWDDQELLAYLESIASQEGVNPIITFE
jgi:hypothetical protein